MYKFILDQNGDCTVNDLAVYLNLTPRTIHRIFTEQIGIIPKNYLKIIRFNHACKLMSKYPMFDWLDIVYNCGYYDQMHFIHEFKSIMNYTPLDFLKISDGNFYFKRPIIIS